jgi:hypothetical protein
VGVVAADDRAIAARSPLRYIAIALTLVLLSLPAAARAQATGTLEGAVVQGTAGGGAVSGLAVRLLVFQGSQRVDEQQGVTDAQGRFRFEGLDPSPERVYFPVVEYHDVSYYPSPVSFKDAPTQSVSITIYEPTGDDAQVLFPRTNLILTGVDPERLYVMEMGVASNRGDRAYAAPETLHFALPAGAESFSPRFGIMAGAVSQRPSGFVLTGPLLPGDHELAYSYELPVQGQQADLSRTLQHPVESFSLFVPAQDSIRVDSPQLAEAGTRDMGGMTYRVYTASNLARGSQLGIRLSGLPEMPGAMAQRLGYALLGGGLAISLGALIIAWRRGVRASTPAPASAAEAADAPDTRRDDLLATLADLDERFEAGELPLAEYQRARDVAKRRLVALLRESNAQAPRSSEADVATDADPASAGRDARG